MKKLSDEMWLKLSPHVLKAADNTYYIQVSVLAQAGIDPNSFHEYSADFQERAQRTAKPQSTWCRLPDGSYVQTSRVIALGESGIDGIEHTHVYLDTGVKVPILSSAAACAKALGIV